MKHINGHKLHILQRGTKNQPAVIFLHHGLGAACAWRKQIDAVAAAGWHVLAYDRLGYGKSDPRTALSMPCFDDDQNDLEALMDALEIERAVLVGHSDGGTIAMAFAANRPQRVQRLVCVAAHIYVEPRMVSSIEAIRQGYESDADFRQRFERVHGDKSQRLFYSWIDGWNKPEFLSWDMRPQLARIACPTWIVQGMQDEHATTQHARDAAVAIPGARLWLAPGAGHMLPQDIPAEFNHRLLEFIRPELKADENSRTPAKEMLSV